MGPQGSCLTEQWGWHPAGSKGCRRRGEKQEQDTRAAAPSFRPVPSTAVAAHRSRAPGRGDAGCVIRGGGACDGVITGWGSAGGGVPSGCPMG